MKYTPENARHVLAENKDSQVMQYRSIREYWEAICDGELPTYFCQRLALFKLYSDDLPGPRLVKEWHPDYPQMKCRASVIDGIAGELCRKVYGYSSSVDFEKISIYNRDESG